MAMMLGGLVTMAAAFWMLIDLPQPEYYGEADNCNCPSKFCPQQDQPLPECNL